MQYKIFQELSNIIHAMVNSFIIFLSAELLHLEAVFQLLKKNSLFSDKFEKSA